MNTRVKCHCGKWLDDPTHKSTHVDKVLTEKEFLKLDLSEITQVRFRKTTESPWHYILSKRHGNDFYMIGIYQPNQ